MSDQPIPPQGGPADGFPEADPQVLSFSCMACEQPLTAPLSAAGVVAPCPTCGANTEAPKRPSEPCGIALQPRPLAAPGGSETPAPRVPAMPSPNDAPGAPGGDPRRPPVATAPKSKGGPEPERRRKRRTKGSINPANALSSDYEDRKEAGALIRILLAVALTVGIVFGVYHFLKKKISGPSAPRVSVLVRMG